MDSRAFAAGGGVVAAAAAAGAAAVYCASAPEPLAVDPAAAPAAETNGREAGTPRLIEAALAEKTRAASPSLPWTASEEGPAGTWERSRMGAALWVASDPSAVQKKPQVTDGAGVRDISALSVASDQFKREAAMLAEKLMNRAREGLEHHPTAMVEAFTSRSCHLEDCIFVGHTNTDMDSVASAIAAAELYDGVAARSAGGGEDPRIVNGEIMHALAFASLPLPPFFQDLPNAMEADGPRVCFVDTNHPTQMIEPLPSQQHRINGCIDHHNVRRHQLPTSGISCAQLCSLVGSMRLPLAERRANHAYDSDP
jgi:hypothetical protein